MIQEQAQQIILLCLLTVQCGPPVRRGSPFLPSPRRDAELFHHEVVEPAFVRVELRVALAHYRLAGETHNVSEVKYIFPMFRARYVISVRSRSVVM